MPVYHFNMIAQSQDTVKMPSFYKNNPSFAGNAAKWAETVAVYDETIDETVYDIDWINEYLESVKNGGFLINYNHPEWSLQNVNDYSNLRNIHSIEIINGGCFKLNENTSLHYDQMLRGGNRVVPTAGDDNHSEKNCFRGWTMIKAPNLSYDSLISAYKKGYCYVSEGPEILSLVMNDDKIIVKTSEVYSIVLRSEGRYCDYVSSEEGKCTEAIFQFSPEKMGKYFRIEIRDLNGYKAFSNAYFTDSI